jgi:hypothetical protein
MLVVDIMQKFELGIWKAIFTHLIRLLYAVGPGGHLVTELDWRCIFSKVLMLVTDSFFTRFRLVPTFRRSTIRCFVASASEMKKLAARNFKDLL